MNAPISIFWELVGQHPASGVEAALADTDNVLWPYYVAISALSAVIVTLFGLLMKANRDRATDAKEHTEEFKLANKAFLEATEERSKRTSEEFGKKDKALLETSVEFAKLMERVANELAKINDNEVRR